MVFMEYVFWISALVLLHTYVGYPLGIAVAAWLWPRPVRPKPHRPQVSVIIVMHNGAAHAHAKLDNIVALDYPPERLEIIVACDGCTDESASICGNHPDSRVRVLDFQRRRGKAACLNDAVSSARGELLLLTDVRQRLELDTLRALVASLGDVDVGAVSGELRLEDPDRVFARGIDAYWRYEKFIRQAESRSGSTVGVTGALYAMRRELFRPLPDGTILDDVLNPMNVVLQGKRVVFESGAIAWDRPTQSPSHERKRKIRTLAGNYQMLHLAPWLIDPRINPICYRLVCHKLLRLLAPWLILAWLMATIVLAPLHIFFALALVTCGIAGVVIVGGLLSPRFARFLPARLLMAFVYLNWYSAEALVAYLRNRRLHLW